MKDKAKVTKPAADAEAMHRLRGRSDELELIISSLTIFALFALPGWLFDKLAGSYTHLSTSLVVAGSVGTPLLDTKPHRCAHGGKAG